MSERCVLYTTLNDITFSMIDMFTVIAKAMNLMKARFNENFSDKGLDTVVCKL